MAYGRGGAGNINQAAYEKERAAEDIESQTHAPPSSSPPPSSTSQPTASSTQQQYAYTGRGGAGNVYSPSQLAQTGTFTTTTTTAPPSSERPSDPPSTGPSALPSTQFSTPRNPSSAPSAGTGNGIGNGVGGSTVHAAALSSSTPLSLPSQSNGGVGDKPPIKTGRGGAGNMVWGGGAEEKERRERVEREVREREEEVRRRVREEVDGVQGLVRPQGAWTGR